MKKITLIYFALCTIFLILSCSEKEYSEEVSKIAQENFINQVGINNLNQDIKVTILEDIEDLNKEYKFGSKIEILIENNNTEKFVYFNPEIPSSIQLFANKDNNWIFLENKAQYLGGGNILSPREGHLDIWKTGVYPEIDVNVFDVNKSLLIRILIVGEYATGDGVLAGEIAGGYTDVILIP